MDVKKVVDELIAAGEGKNFEKWEKEITARLYKDVDHYSWVGFYWLDQHELVLGAWDGPEATEHTRIDVGEGICGLAARTGNTEIVDDVHEHGEYLACFPSTKSEIVIPVRAGGEVVGELDIDSDKTAAFTGEDKKELERLVEGIEARLSV